MSNECVDCKASPGANAMRSCFSETFPVTAPGGSQIQLTLRLCLGCGARFEDRISLRAYLSTRLPAYGTAVAYA